MEKNSKIYVAGHRGMVGSAIVRELQRQDNSEKQRWDGAKIYDPQRGIKVNVTLSFDSPKKLLVRGTVFGIGETVTWTKE